MIIRLFRVFDPISYRGIRLNWMILLLVMLYFPIKFYMVGEGYKEVMRMMMEKVKDVFKGVSYPKHIGILILCVIVFFFLIIRNLVGLFPFVFTRTAHPIITIRLGVVFWVSFVVIGWVKQFKESAAHLVPEGSPIILSPLLVLIESVSHVIRPFTLSIRLAANIMAGHLIVGLLASIRNIRIFGMLSSVIIQRILLILEFAVGVIQGFVFRILLILYALEYY